MGKPQSAVTVEPCAVKNAAIDLGLPAALNVVDSVITDSCSAANAVTNLKIEPGGWA